MDTNELEALQQKSDSPQVFYDIKDNEIGTDQLDKIYDFFEPNKYEHRWVYRGLALNPNCNDSLLVKLANNLDHFVAYSAAIKIYNKPDSLEKVKLHWHESVRKLLKQTDEYKTISEKMKSDKTITEEIFTILDMNLMVTNSNDPYAQGDEYENRAELLGLNESFDENDLSLLPPQFQSYEELIDDLTEIYETELIETYWHSELIILAALNKNLDIDKFSKNVT
jgi:hypothetical protein